MKTLTVDVQGMCVCHFGSRLSALMLNSGHDPSLKIPPHHQTLVLERAAVDSTDQSADAMRVPTLSGLVRDGIDVDANYIGWDISGCTVHIGDGNRPRRARPVSKDIHPDPNNPDWSDMRWVMDISRFSPGSFLRPDAMLPTDDADGVSKAVAVFSGGAVAGAPPQNGNADCYYIHDFAPQYQQAVTDSLRYKLDFAQTTKIQISKPGFAASIVLNRSCEGHLVNEATPLDIAKEVNKYGHSARHASGMYAAFEHLLKVPQPPVRGRRFVQDVGIAEGVFCIIMTVGAE